MQVRARTLNSAPRNNDARYVLYWTQMNRRVRSNHALVHAANLANECGLPLLFYEGLTCSYPHANERLHTFLLEGVPTTAAELKKLGIGYAFYLRKRHTDPNDTLYQLARHAAAVVTDDYPVFVARSHNESAPAKLSVPYHAVDSSCIVPMALIEKREWAAYTIRPKLHRLLKDHLHPVAPPKINHPWRDPLPDWHTEVEESDIPALVAACEIDHSVKPSISAKGGARAARKVLKTFLEQNLRRYARERNEPAAHATSELSPYLHFGHISSLEAALAAKEHAAEHKLMADEFLEELIVRRELAFNYCRYAGNAASFDHLPDWAKQTMDDHAGDPREHIYTREEFEFARTGDPLWNAAQKEMLWRGKIHGYYRMYWGKKIIEWSATYQDALETMVYLHDRYALDGRDPNTYTNILWCFGLHDRPWPERPVFGKIRYMSYEGMRRKTNSEAYLREIDFIERTGRDPWKGGASPA